MFNLSSENFTPIYQKFPPLIEEINGEEIPTFQWDIPYTIKDISYLTHSHYRYYGKFPSVLAGKIIDLFPPKDKDSYILDNFCGSGTTLVEAKLRGINSVGLDINWISALASNVKTKHVDIKKIRQLHDRILFLYEKDKSNPLDSNLDLLSSFEEKWFVKENVKDLKILQNILLNLEPSDELDFIVVAFLGIIRRVSKAYDGEVRPHINKEKKVRDVISAFSKKINDMISDHIKYMEITNSDTVGTCYVGNNLDLPNIIKEKNIYLVINHPPYLNSFNYSPIFSLELYWGKAFEKNYSTYIELYKKEMKAHPASESITEQYFNHLRDCYKQTFNIQKKGDYLAVVIGDCTRKGELIPVLKNTQKIIEEIGYKTIMLNYRTTHYGLGKYAYKHRADYHDDINGKKDGILIFQK